MDQVKNILAAAKKYHFWILCGLAMLIGLGMYLSASSSLSKAYKAQKDKISGVDSQLTPFTSGDHPNQTSVNAVKQKTEEARRQVFDAWNQLYQQQAKTVFQWPADLNDDPAFLQAFAAPDKSGDKSLDRRKVKEFCDRYLTYITKTTLPRLSAIIEAKWTIDDNEVAAARTDAADVAARYKVVWDPTDQQHRSDDYNWGATPSRLDVRYAQEEMWVMEAVFRAIQRANSGAGGAYDAAVRQLNEVLIGYDATNRYPLGEGAGRIIRPVRPTVPGANGPTGSGPIGAGGDTGGSAPRMLDAKRPDRMHGGVGGNDAGPRYGRGGPSGRGGPVFADASGGSGGAEGGAADPEAWLKDGRYVNAKCQPMMDSEVRSSTTPEFNLMAFRLKLVVDESQYQRVVDELANSVLPIEVREVRILPAGENAFRNVPVNRPGGGGRQVGGPRGRSSGPAGGPSGPAGRALGPGRPAPAAQQAEAGGTLHNIPLEIYGVAYLINPPKKTASSDAPADGTAPAGTGAAATPAAAATGAAATTGSAATATAPAPTEAGAAPTGTTPATGATTPATDKSAPPSDKNAATPAPTESPPAAPDNSKAAGDAPATPKTSPPDAAPTTK